MSFHRACCCGGGVVGVCCLPGGGCIDGVTESECAATSSNGLFIPGAVCGPPPLPCFPCTSPSCDSCTTTVNITMTMVNHHSFFNLTQCGFIHLYVESITVNVPLADPAASCSNYSTPLDLPGGSGSWSGTLDDAGLVCPVITTYLIGAVTCTLGIIPGTSDIGPIYQVSAGVKIRFDTTGHFPGPFGEVETDFFATTIAAYTLCPSGSGPISGVFPGTMDSGTYAIM